MSEVLDLFECKENYNSVNKQIHNCTLKSNRNMDEIVLIAVSKTKPIEMLREVYDTGCRDFGENKVQEIVDKYDLMPKDTRFHMIGHLQRNKVKYIIDKVVMIHSVDSFRLAEEINKEALKRNLSMDILIEVNVAEEESKFGLKVEETLDFVKKVALLSNVQIRGLMTIAPFVTDPEENRDVFRKLRQLSVDIDKQNIDNVYMNVLSMGMTGDYLVAVEEGATHVRVGTGIFGGRS